MKVCIYGFSGQNMNLWLKYFRDHTEDSVTLFTPSFSPSREYSFQRLRVIEIEKNGNRLFSSIFSRYIKLRTALILRRNRFDLVIMHGLYNRAFAPFLFLKARSGRKIITLWNDLNHRRIHKERENPEYALILEALHAADLILPTWQPTRNSFASEFPELSPRTTVRSWGTDIEMLRGMGKNEELPEQFRRAVENRGKPILFWPRTIREGIRHDLLLEALLILKNRDVELVSILPMGKSGEKKWDRHVLSLLEKAGKDDFVIADHSGHIPLQDLYGVYSSADLMVNLADSDQVSTCVVEAFLFELDIILSDIPPYRALAEMGLHLRLVPHEPEKIADAIEETLSSINSEASRENRKKNREIAESLFDLRTNLKALISLAMNSEPPGKSLLFLSPQIPPFGGVADQSSLLMTNPVLAGEFKIFPERTNPCRRTEDPSRRGEGATRHFLNALFRALFGRTSCKPDVIQLVANGDVSFIRDMIIASILKYRYKAPLAVHLHGSRKGFWHNRSTPVQSGCRESEPGLRSKIGYFFCRRLLKKADSLTQLTSEIDGFYRSIGFPAANVIIPNAAAAGMESFQPGEPGRFLFTGRLTRAKGFFDLLNSLGKMATGDWTLDVLGDYTSDGERIEAAELLSIHPWRERINLRGTVTGEDKWEFFRSASIFVLPTYIDVFPVVILEAMAFGCAIVTTEVGEIRGISGSDNFNFVTPGDIEAIKEALTSLSENNGICAGKGAQNHKASALYSAHAAAELMRDNLVNTLAGKKNG